MGLLADSIVSKNLTTVPVPIRNYLELKSGDRIEWHIIDGQIQVRKQGTKRPRASKRLLLFGPESGLAGWTPWSRQRIASKPWNQDRESTCMIGYLGIDSVEQPFQGMGTKHTLERYP